MLLFNVVKLMLNETPHVVALRGVFHIQYLSGFESNVQTFYKSWQAVLYVTKHHVEVNLLSLREAHRKHGRRKREAVLQVFLLSHGYRIRHFRTCLQDLEK